MNIVSFFFQFNFSGVHLAVILGMFFPLFMDLSALLLSFSGVKYWRNFEIGKGKKDEEIESLMEDLS